MERETQRRLDGIRAGRTELDNTLIGEFAAGRLSRRQFVRAGTVIGISLPTLGIIGSLLEACTPSSQTQGGLAVVKGGRISIGLHPSPATAMDPILIHDAVGTAILGLAGEYLAFSDRDLRLQPRLAESWTPNADGTVWTFRIRQGVKFSDGSTVTADDVVATFNRLADPAITGNNALSVFKGVLSKGGAAKVDPSTVKFQLDAANGHFPYLVSSDNYNAIILPAGYSGGWDRNFIGAGPWKLRSYNVNQSLSFDRNPGYWDGDNTPPLDGLDITFYADEQPALLAFQSGSLDVLPQFSARTSQALLTDPNATIIDIPTSNHRQVHLRTDRAPFDDRLVRQALAYAIDRQAAVTGLWNGKAQVANDHPIFKIFPSSDISVAERGLDLKKAKDLMAQSGKSAGFAVTLYTEKLNEIPDLAALVQSAGKSIGINIDLNVSDSGPYYDKYWLDSPLGITDYGHRGVPDVFLQATLQSAGPWNAAHFKNSDYDSLVQQYLKAVDVPSQKVVSGRIEQLLLDQAPLIIPYTFDSLTATKKNIAGVEPTGVGHLDLRRAGRTR